MLFGAILIRDGHISWLTTVCRFKLKCSILYCISPINRPIVHTSMHVNKYFLVEELPSLNLNLVRELSYTPLHDQVVYV